MDVTIYRVSMGEVKWTVICKERGGEGEVT